VAAARFIEVAVAWVVPRKRRSRREAWIAT
jgi:hypothetical protein